MNLASVLTKYPQTYCNFWKFGYSLELLYCWGFLLYFLFFGLHEICDYKIFDVQPAGFIS